MTLLHIYGFISHNYDFSLMIFFKSNFYNYFSQYDFKSHNYDILYLRLISNIYNYFSQNDFISHNYDFLVFMTLYLNTTFA